MDRWSLEIGCHGWLMDITNLLVDVDSGRRAVTRLTTLIGGACSGVAASTIMWGGNASRHWLTAWIVTVRSTKVLTQFNSLSELHSQEA